MLLSLSEKDTDDYNNDDYDYDNNDNYKEGILLILNQMKDILKNSNVEFISPTTGDIFDDSIHEAIAAVPTEDNEMKGKVAYRTFDGYKLGNCIIRYAKVGVYV